MPTSLDDAVAQLGERPGTTCTIDLPDSDRGPVPCFVFDPRNVDEDALAELLEDTFCDGMPPGLDLRASAPFAVVGVSGDPFDDSADGQTEGLLFLEHGRGDGESCPVSVVDVDGTAIASTYRTVAGSVEELALAPA